MKPAEVYELSSALSHHELKVKYLSSDSYVKLLELKRPMKKFLTELGEDEKALFDSYNGEVKINDNGIIEGGGKEFRDKLKEIQKRQFEAKNLNFIEGDEFKKFTDEVDFSTASLLAEYLLK